MEQDSNNPAGRLHDFLTVLRNQSRNGAVALGVRRALSLDDDSEMAEVLPYLGIATTWPQQAKEQIEALDGVNHDRLLGWGTNVDNIFKAMMNFGATMESVIVQVNEIDMEKLGHCDDLLRYRAPEPIITTEKLTDLSELVREAIEAVIADTDLNEEARHWLVARLQEVLQALTHFRVSGYEGVDAAMERLHGGIVHRPPTQTATTHGWFNRLWAALSLSAQGTKQIADASGAVIGIIEQISN